MGLTTSRIDPQTDLSPTGIRHDRNAQLQPRDINRDGDVQAVPEPSTPALLGLAPPALLALRMTRRHAVQATTDR